MILLKQNKINEIALSLNDVSFSADTTFYLFNVTNTTNTPTFFTVEDISQCSLRASIFDITLSDLTGSTVTLSNGFYDYEVYGVASLSDIALSAVTTTVLNTGQLYVSGDTTGLTYYTDSVENKNNFYK